MRTAVGQSMKPEPSTAKYPDASIPSKENWKNLSTTCWGAHWAGVVMFLLYQTTTISAISSPIAERRRRRRAGRIHHVQLAFALNEVKIVHQRALRRHGLRTHARSAWNQVVRLDLGNQPLQRTAEQLAAETAADLIPARLAVFPEKSPQSGERKRVGQIREVRRRPWCNLRARTPAPRSVRLRCRP